MRKNLSDIVAVYVILDESPAVSSGHGPFRSNAVQDFDTLFERPVRGLDFSEIENPVCITIKQDYLDAPGTDVDSAHDHEIHPAVRSVRCRPSPIDKRTGMLWDFFNRCSGFSLQGLVRSVGASRA
jgi:hypothetical protein